MERHFKKIKVKIKSNLLIKIAKIRKENKIYKDKIEEMVLKEQEYINKINLMKIEIRDYKRLLKEVK